MNQVRTFITLLFAVLIIFGIAAAQGRSRNKPRKTSSPTSASAPAPSSNRRMVTVNLTQGDAVRGTFIHADADTIEVEVKGGRLTFKTNEVASLVFTTDQAANSTPAKAADEPAKTPTPTPDPTMPAARKAYAALRKLADASQIGLPYVQYGGLLLEARAVVDESTRALPETGLKAEILQAIDAYTDAGKAWSAMQANGVLLIAAEPGASLVNKYNLKPVANALGQADRLQLDTTLGAIWATAAAHLENVKGLIR